MKPLFNGIGTLRLVSTKDGFIHCFKKGRPSEAGRQKLNSQLLILVEEDDAVSPFIFPSDYEEANEEMNVIKGQVDEEIIM